MSLVLTAGLFAIGLWRLRRAKAGSGFSRISEPRRFSGIWEPMCFAGGWLALFVALVSPLHAWGSVLFSAHMTQHEVLMLVAAPLLVLSRPIVVFLWSFPVDWSRKLGNIAKIPAVSH